MVSFKVLEEISACGQIFFFFPKLKTLVVSYLSPPKFLTISQQHHTGLDFFHLEKCSHLSHIMFRIDCNDFTNYAPGQLL